LHETIEAVVVVVGIDGVRCREIVGAVDDRRRRGVVGVLVVVDVARSDGVETSD